MSVPLASFGPGILIITRTDVATSYPINVGYAQELNLDFAGTTKPLFGQNQYPLVAARGTIKSTGKWKAATLSGMAWMAAFYGQGTSSTSIFTSGGFKWNVASTFTSSTTVTTLQVGSSSGSSQFQTDLGVRYAAGNLPLLRVTTGNETTGCYSVASTQP